ncbi:hypothetical protein AAE478_006054 [Parahypoxylon ruwenzoriense]
MYSVIESSNDSSHDRTEATMISTATRQEENDSMPGDTHSAETGSISTASESQLPTSRTPSVHSLTGSELQWWLAAYIPGDQRVGPTNRSSKSYSVISLSSDFDTGSLVETPVASSNGDRLSTYSLTGVESGLSNTAMTERDAVPTMLEITFKRILVQLKSQERTLHHQQELIEIMEEEKNNLLFEINKQRSMIDYIERELTSIKPIADSARTLHEGWGLQDERNAAYRQPEEHKAMTSTNEMVTIQNCREADGADSINQDTKIPNRHVVQQRPDPENEEPETQNGLLEDDQETACLHSLQSQLEAKQLGCSTIRDPMSEIHTQLKIAVLEKSRAQEMIKRLQKEASDSQQQREELVNCNADLKFCLDKALRRCSHLEEDLRGERERTSINTEINAQMEDELRLEVSGTKDNGAAALAVAEAEMGDTIQRFKELQARMDLCISLLRKHSKTKLQSTPNCAIEEVMKDEYL